MNKLSKEKRNQLILVILATLVVICGLWFTLIRFQQSALRVLQEKRAKCEADLSRIRETINNAKQIETELAQVNSKLATKEQTMPSGDLYSTMISFISRFRQPYNVYIPQFHSDRMAADVNLLPKFPYKQITVSVAGTARFYDLGRFIADFENQFPTSRILNLELTPASAQGPDEREKLSFKMDIVSLVKTSGPRPGLATP